MEKLEDLDFKVSLNSVAHQLAQKLYVHHTNPQKAKQVYLNTLAIYAVNYYLQCFGIDTDLESSDRHNHLIRSLADVADLSIKNIGTIECRPVLPKEQFCYVPAEVWHDRIGYVAVRLNETLTEASLLGFVERVETENLPLTQLQSLDNLLEYLTARSEDLAEVHLHQWFDNILDRGWQKLMKLLQNLEAYSQSTQQENLAFRGWSNLENKTTVKAAKMFNLTTRTKPNLLAEKKQI